MRALERSVRAELEGAGAEFFDNAEVLLKRAPRPGAEKCCPQHQLLSKGYRPICGACPRQLRGDRMHIPVTEVHATKPL
jgi:hypothetical protein